ncbi:hypothetical protein RND71_042941 [Anisodus tanguticus]|uniref:Uncharacterized protein n=1 Tax=Anisodus tanguticus TaxID=243964 RepID=A0AAE1UV86_9SOLA|nr:hypothetical protein RND71_042941 [Anisodus tanguticus]
MVIMAARDFNTMVAILILTYPLLGSGLCPLAHISFNYTPLNHIKLQIMNHKIARVSTAAIEGFRGTKPLQRRGQIKSRIAANAFHSIISVLSKAPSVHHHHQHFIRKN